MVGVEVERGARAARFIGVRPWQNTRSPYIVYNMQTSKLPTIHKPALRTEVEALLRNEITAGRIRPSTRLREVDLARQVGVSRTPVREALLALEAQGFVHSDARRGFYTGPLTAEEAGEIYPILAALECLALRLAGIPSHEELDELDAMNRRLAAYSDRPEPGLALDNEWHELLLCNLANRRLGAEIRRMKGLVRRYEIAYMRDGGRVAQSVRQHSEVVEALRSGFMDKASEALEANWRVTFEQLDVWLGT